MENFWTYYRQIKEDWPIGTKVFYVSLPTLILEIVGHKAYTDKNDDGFIMCKGKRSTVGYYPWQIRKL